jgi:chemotaxis protein methyltransferase CheR
MKEVSLSPSLFSILSSLVEEHVGLAYSLADKTIFENKVLARAADAGFESALDYYYFLRYDDASGGELQALVQALLVHETFFFRELGPVRIAVEQLIRPLVARGAKPRIWCAACSTGEEPLSLAMLLSQLGLLDKVELVATDLSAAALERAQNGTFSRRAVRHICPAELKPFLTATESGYKVPEELICAIEWRRLNLLVRADIEALGHFDLILCRNVLIYFRDETVNKVISSLAARLRPGGALLVGISESLMRYDSELMCEERDGTFLYRKAAR